ncbi:MAG: lamin tail domain-containing protein [Oscillochloridaceae bacterium umkhey_bin13]
MSKESPRSPRHNPLIDTAEDLALGVGRVGYGLLGWGLGLLPSQSRQHMHNAIRELSYSFASLPRDFAEIAGHEIERWARADDEPKPGQGQQLTAGSAAPVNRLVGTDLGMGAEHSPTLAAPVIELPGTGTPDAEPSVIELPGTGTPDAEAPVIELPGTGTPDAETPVIELPGTGTPDAETPVIELPGTGTPDAKTPVIELPGTGTPDAETPVIELPGTGTPDAKTPVIELPGTGTPDAETPVMARPDAIAAAPTLAPSNTTGVTISHLEYNPPTGRNVDGEYVQITNESSEPVDLTGWNLHDGDKRHSFTFPRFKLAPGASVKVWTRQGRNDHANLYWGRRSAIWNNSGDTGTLKDATGRTISSHSYTGTEKRKRR